MGINRPISNLIQHTFVLCDEREKDVLSLRPDAMIRPSHVHCLKLARFHGCSLTERRSMWRNMKTSPWVRWPAGWDNCAKPAMTICVRRKILKVWDELQKSFCNSPSQVTATWEFLAKGLGSGGSGHAKKHCVALQRKQRLWPSLKPDSCTGARPAARSILGIVQF